jgi:hypothetical protein
MGSSIGGLVGGVAGSFFGAPTVGAALGSGIGGMIGGGAQSGAAAGAAGAAGSSIYGAGQQAQQMAQFRPVGITTNFGKSNFEFDPYGQLTSAGYTLDPRLQGIQSRLLTQAEQYRPEDIAAAARPLMGGAQSLFGLGGQLLPTDTSRMSSAQAQQLAEQYRQAQAGLMPTSYQTGATPEAMALAQQFRQTGAGYLAQSPEEARAEYMRTQQAALAPGRAAEEARLATANYGRGTGGLGVQTGTGSAPSNPLAQALFNARGQQDLQLATQAEQAAQQRQAFGLSNLGQGLTAQQQSEATQRANMLQNLGLSLGYGTQGLSTAEAGTELARQRFASDVGLGAGLFQQGGGLLGQVPALTSAGYSPLQTQLGLASTTEAMGQQALDIGSALGARQSSAGANAGQLGLLGASRAAPYQVEQQSYSPLGQVLGGSSGQLGAVGGQVGNWFGDLIGGGKGMGLLNASSSSQDYMNRIGATSSGPLSSANAYANEWWM